MALWLALLYLLLFAMSFLRGTEVMLGSSATGKDMLRFSIFLAPYFMQQALPIALLLGIQLGVGRLSEDGETTAMQSLGVGPWQVMRGPILLGAVGGAAMLLLSFTLEPWGLRGIRDAANEMIKKNLAGDVRAGVFYDELRDLTLYAERVDQRRNVWSNLLIHDDRDPASPLLVLATKGSFDPSGHGEAMKLVLESGSVHRLRAPSGEQGPEGTEYSITDFRAGELVIDVADSFRKNRFRRPMEEMTPPELLEASRRAEAAGEDARPFLFTYHTRFGRALMPVAFAILGTPLAMSRKSGARAKGYLLTIGGYVAYYVLTRLFEGFARQGQMSIFLATQLPNLIFAALGFWALRQVSRAGGSK